MATRILSRSEAGSREPRPERTAARFQFFNLAGYVQFRRSLERCSREVLNDNHGRHETQPHDSRHSLAGCFLSWRSLKCEQAIKERCLWAARNTAARFQTFTCWIFSI